MPKPEDENDLKDVMAAEGSRGSKNPKRIETLEEERRLRNIARVVRRKGYTEEEFINDLSEFVPDKTSPAFRNYLKLWREFHRQTS